MKILMVPEDLAEKLELPVIRKLKGGYVEVDPQYEEQIYEAMNLYPRRSAILNMDEL